MRSARVGFSVALTLLAACGGDDGEIVLSPGAGGGGQGGGAAAAGAAGKTAEGGAAGRAGAAGKAGNGGKAGSSAGSNGGTAGASGSAAGASGGPTAGSAGSAGFPAGSAGSGGKSGNTSAGAAGSVAGGTAGSGAASGSAGTSGTAGAGGKGETCATGVLCGPEATCCATGSECVKEACKATCGSGVRCGEADTCCGAGDVCIAGACTKPGGACADYADCDDAEFCDPVLKKCLPQTGEPACVFKPAAGKLTPKLEWSWTGSPIKPTFFQVINTPLVADLDAKNGAVPEVVIVTSEGYTDTTDPAYLRLLDGKTGKEIWTDKVAAYSDAGRVQCRSVPAVGDIDGDGKVDIVAAKFGGGIIAFNADGSIKWRSKDDKGKDSDIALQSTAVSLANLDGDAGKKVEIVVGGIIYDSKGILLVDQGALFGSNDGAYGAVSIVADVVGDARPEILSGKRAIDRTGKEVWASTEHDGYTAIADLDLDGKPELVVVSSMTINKVTTSEVRVQDAATGMVLARLAVPGTGAGGPPTIAQFDGKGGQDFALANGDKYAVFTYVSSPTPAIKVLWSKDTQDISSNRTGSTVFDFDGDGQAEVVYNDECFMRVYRGLDGEIVYEEANPSATIHEYPVVADVDGDNNTEIIVGANDRNKSCDKLYTNGATYRHGVFVYGDAKDQWVRTRRIWNQHSYHVTNVGTDGSIPVTEAKSWGPSGFNNYRQSTQGRQAYNAPDLAVTLEISLAKCADGLLLRAHVKNEGSVTAPAGIDLTFYKGAPPGGTVVTSVKTKAPLLPGGIEDVEFVVPGGKDLSAYYVVADANAAGVGIINECIETNNTGAVGAATCSKD